MLPYCRRAPRHLKGAGRRFLSIPPAFRRHRTGACAVCPQWAPCSTRPSVSAAFGSRQVTPVFRRSTYLNSMLPGNTVRPFHFPESRWQRITVLSPDPGLALITGAIDGDPNFDLARRFLPAQLVQDTDFVGRQEPAPYFTDNSAPKPWRKRGRSLYALFIDASRTSLPDSGAG